MTSSFSSPGATRVSCRVSRASDSVRESSEEQPVTKDVLSRRISVDPRACFGKPCIRGHRIWVSLILDLLASGSSFREILENYPGLEEAESDG